MPTIVSTPCASGCSAMTIRPAAIASKLIRVDQSAGTDVIAIGHRQPLGVVEQIICGSQG
jgi:hypothetical protein